MPIYEYFCGPCNNQFEILKNMSDKMEFDTCPQCKTRVRRVYSAVVGVVVNGTPKFHPK